MIFLGVALWLMINDPRVGHFIVAASLECAWMFFDRFGPVLLDGNARNGTTGVSACIWAMCACRKDFRS